MCILTHILVHYEPTHYAENRVELQLRLIIQQFNELEMGLMYMYKLTHYGWRVGGK